MMAPLDRDRIVGATDLAILADELLGPRTTPIGMWRCPNPSHQQSGRTPPVSVFRAAGGEQRWHCHGCGVGGTAIDLVMTARGVPVREALEQLAERAAITSPPHHEPRPARTKDYARQTGGVSDPDGLAAYVDECAQRLWRPDGRPVLRWLTANRQLPADVLRFNHVGADPGPRHQRRPAGMPIGGWAAVLPAYEHDRPVFAQLRAITTSPGRPRYLNAAGRLAPNPRAAFYEPPQRVGRCVIVTEGILDALTANAAGYRAVAVLGAALAAPSTQDRNPLLERIVALRSPLVVAFDADPAGETASGRLANMLRARGAQVVRLRVPEEANDLNGWMCGTANWQREFKASLGAAFRTQRDLRRVAVAR
jgi:hypothetical protein